jgi:hypothetical protein
MSFVALMSACVRRARSAARMRLRSVLGLGLPTGALLTSCILPAFEAATTPTPQGAAGLGPFGWTEVAFSTENVPCPAGYGNGESVVVDPTGAAAICGCTCAGSPAKCGGTVTWLRWAAANCPTATQAASATLDGNGACTGLVIGYAAGVTSTVSPELVPIQGSCTGTRSEDRPPVNAPIGQLCMPTSTVPAAPPFARCVVQDGASLCPSGYPERHLIGAGSPGYIDSRQCSACNCGTNATCTDTTTTFYELENCAGIPRYRAKGTCQDEPSAVATLSYQTTATVVNGACQVTSNSAPSGDVVPNAARTVCCP